MQNDHVSERQATAMHIRVVLYNPFASGQIILQYKIKCLYAGFGCGVTCQSPCEECSPPVKNSQRQSGQHMKKIMNAICQQPSDMKKNSSTLSPRCTSDQYVDACLREGRPNCQNVENADWHENVLRVNVSPRRHVVHSSSSRCIWMARNRNADSPIDGKHGSIARKSPGWLMIECWNHMVEMVRSLLWTNGSRFKTRVQIQTRHARIIIHLTLKLGGLGLCRSWVGGSLNAGRQRN